MTHIFFSGCRPAPCLLPSLLRQRATQAESFSASAKRRRFCCLPGASLEDSELPCSQLTRPNSLSIASYATTQTYFYLRVSRLLGLAPVRAGVCVWNVRPFLHLILSHEHSRCDCPEVTIPCTGITPWIRKLYVPICLYPPRSNTPMALNSASPVLFFCCRRALASFGDDGEAWKRGSSALRHAFFSLS
jgi:hypothetical protein